MPAQSGENGKVTIAVLSTKLDTLLVGQDRLTSRVEGICAAHDLRIGNLETEQGVLTERINGVKDDLQKVEKIANSWNFGNSLVAGLANVLAFIGINK